MMSASLYLVRWPCSSLSVWHACSHVVKSRIRLAIDRPDKVDMRRPGRMKDGRYEVLDSESIPENWTLKSPNGK